MKKHAVSAKMSTVSSVKVNEDTFNVITLITGFASLKQNFHVQFLPVCDHFKITGIFVQLNE